MAEDFGIIKLNDGNDMRSFKNREEWDDYVKWLASSLRRDTWSEPTSFPCLYMTSFAIPNPDGMDYENGFFIYGEFIEGDD